MNTYNVIIEDVNAKKFVPYDVLPYFREQYEEKKKKERPQTFEEFKKFVKDEALYMFWSRCEWEVVLVSWPTGNAEKKIDVYWQIDMNLDLVTRLLMEDILTKNANKK